MEQLELLQIAVDILERLGVPYALVGSFGSSIFGEPRFTRDIDILIDLPESDVSAFCAAFAVIDPAINVEAIRDSVRARLPFNAVHSHSGNKIDFVLPRSDAWGRSQLSRARRMQILPGLEVQVASPEDVILGKLWYFSEGGGDRHLRDIAGMLRVYRDRIDREVIERWAGELGLLDIWRQIIAKESQPDQRPGPGVP